MSASTAQPTDVMLSGHYDTINVTEMVAKIKRKAESVESLIAKGHKNNQFTDHNGLIDATAVIRNLQKVNACLAQAEIILNGGKTGANA